MDFKDITVCLDLYGCPNRCKHCWLGVTPNGNLDISELELTAEQFRPFTSALQIYDWYREPDFKDNYRDLFSLCNRISDKPIEHFELASFWRIARDPSYVKWLSSLGLKRVQLTLFGTEDTTDFYIGRKGAYQEILKAIEILLNNQIAPRIQAFVNKRNLDELDHIERLIKDFDLINHCSSFGGEFSFFLHSGSCDGENEKWYDDWITPEDLKRIPPFLEMLTLRHFGKNNLLDVFGKPEQLLYEELLTDQSTSSYVNDSPVFYIDKDFYVYPNISTPASHWCLGNLKEHGAATILENYMNSNSIAQHTRLTVPLSEMVKSQGNKDSQRLFNKDDYIIFLLNQYCRK